MLGTLYLVATPIGNLQDITLRALDVLKMADIIACEDTRHTGKLLKHFSIHGKLLSYHAHNEEERSEQLVALLQAGKSIAVVSDAGTPGISDPSFRVVQKAHKIGAKVTSVPGAVAFVSAAIISGLPTDSIFFGGFLPSKKGERQRRLKEIREVPATLVFYETPHRIAAALSDCLKILGNRKSCVVRELTKIHEETLRGDLETLAERFADQKTKGEIVLIVDKKRLVPTRVEEDIEQAIVKRVEELKSNGFDHKESLKIAAKEFGMGKSEAYKILLNNKTNPENTHSKN